VIDFTPFVFRPVFVIFRVRYFLGSGVLRLKMKVGFSEFPGIFWLILRAFVSFGTSEVQAKWLFRETSKLSRPVASVIAIVFRRWNLNPVAEFRILGNPPLPTVHHFNRFAFHHQLKQLPAFVSAIATIFRV
jgi:hypothetical protein